MLTILQFSINSELSLDERRLAGNRRRWRHGGRDQGTKDAHREANGLPEEAARQNAAGQTGRILAASVPGEGTTQALAQSDQSVYGRDWRTSRAGAHTLRRLGAQGTRLRFLVPK